MKVTFLGTTSLLFDDGKDQILFDCHVTRPTVFDFLFKKLSTDTEVSDRVINQFKMDRLKAIFISHTHHDHVMDAPYFAKKCNAKIYGSKSARNVALGGGIKEEDVFCYEDSMKYEIGDYKISIIPSIHSKAHWYNNDLGQTIDKPLIQPVKKKEYKEGGSFDFLVENNNKKYLIRPSYNFIEGQLDGIEADAMFLGIAGLSKDNENRKNTFYKETIDKVKPHTVIPVHWDNFLSPLYKKEKWRTGIVEDPNKAISIIENECNKRRIEFILQLPLSEIKI